MCSFENARTERTVNMPEPPPSNLSATEHAASRLHEIAQRLRQQGPLGPEEQRSLADLADELGAALERPATASESTPALADTITHLAQTMQHPHNRGLLERVRERLEDAAANMEARSPHVAAFTRELVDIIAGLGI
jgi:proline dehydrogenase